MGFPKGTYRKSCEIKHLRINVQIDDGFFQWLVSIERGILWYRIIKQKITPEFEGYNSILFFSLVVLAMVVGVAILSQNTCGLVHARPHIIYYFKPVPTIQCIVVEWNEFLKCYIVNIDGFIDNCLFFLLETITSVVFRRKLKITRIVQVLSWVLWPDCNDNYKILKRINYVVTLHTGWIF